MLLTSAGGDPLPDARLELVRRPLADPIRSATADSLGEVVLPDARFGDELRATAAGYAPRVASLDEPPWPEPFVLPLQPGVQLARGFVEDERGNPVAGARIALDDGVRILRAESDGSGHFALWAERSAALPPEILLHVEAEGYCFLANDLPLPPNALLVDGELKLVVMRWAELAVRVQDADGEPVCGAALSLLLDLEGEAVGTAPGLTGSAVQIESPFPGEIPRGEVVDQVLSHIAPMLPLMLAVDHPDLGRLELPLAAFEPGERRREVVTLRGPLRGSTVRFRVVPRDGGDVATGRVAVRVGDAGDGYTSYVDLPEDGTFVVDRPPRAWQVSVQVPGYSPLVRSFAPDFHSDGAVELVIDPSDVGLVVHVVDERGEPQAGVLVRAVGEDDAGVQALMRRTDETGAAHFLGLDESGSYRVTVGDGRPGSYVWKPRTDDFVPSPAAYRGVRPRSDPLRFALVPPASLAGRIEADLPAGARVYLSCFERIGADPPPIFTVSCPAGEDGSFLFHGLPPGRYHLWSNAYGESDFMAPMARFDVMEGDMLRDVIVRP